MLTVDRGWKLTKRWVWAWLSVQKMHSDTIIAHFSNVMSEKPKEEILGKAGLSASRSNQIWRSVIESYFKLNLDENGDNEAPQTNADRGAQSDTIDGPHFLME